MIFKQSETISHRSQKLFVMMGTQNSGPGSRIPPRTTTAANTNKHKTMNGGADRKVIGIIG